MLVARHANVVNGRFESIRLWIAFAHRFASVAISLGGLESIRDGSVDASLLRRKHKDANLCWLNDHQSHVGFVKW